MDGDMLLIGKSGRRKKRNENRHWYLRPSKLPKSDQHHAAKRVVCRLSDTPHNQPKPVNHSQ